MKTIVKIIAFCAAICTTYSLCNTCSLLTGLACVANDTFSTCVNGLPTTTSVTQCPSGTVCISDSSSICIQSGLIAASCARCGICSTNKAFACTSLNEYALCYGTTVPSTVNIPCSGNLVCNIDYPQMCSNPAVTGMGGTCPSVSTTVTTTTTTVSPTINPQAYCRSLASSGRHEITADLNCKKYILCALVNSTWIGNIYECPGSTFFNSTSGLCGVAVPQRCA